MKKLLTILIITILISLNGSEELLHKPYKLKQYLNQTLFGEIVLTVEGYKEHSIKGLLKSIEIKLPKKTLKVPSEVLAKMNLVEINYWLLSTESDWDGIPRIYLKTKAKVYTEKGYILKDFLLDFTEQGFQKLRIDIQSIEEDQEEIKAEKP